MARLAILGSQGMLGSMAMEWLGQNHEVTGFCRNPKSENEKHFDADCPKYADLQSFDYVINCIGVLNHEISIENPASVARAIRINAFFPWDLAVHIGASLIHVSTDGVFSGLRGGYAESDVTDPQDIYGKSKALGEVVTPNSLSIRCSITGPELQSSRSLLEWLRHQPPGASVTGYSNQTWNGSTTLQFAQLCDRMIQTESFSRLRQETPVVHFTPNAPVSKYELLRLISKIYNLNVKVNEGPGPRSIDRVLTSRSKVLAELYQATTFEDSLAEQKLFAEKTGRFRK